MVDSQVVAGPLAQTTSFQGRFAYEVTAGGRLLHAGSVPDLGEVRSFAHPNGTLEQRRHHQYTQSRYEFDVRVSSEQLKGVDLSTVAITLFRTKVPDAIGAPPPAAPSISLAVERERQFREIGRVVGVPPGLQPAEYRFEGRSAGTRRSTKTGGERDQRIDPDAQDEPPIDPRDGN